MVVSQQRVIYPQEERISRPGITPGIITQRRMPHHWPGDTARKPLPRLFSKAQPAAPLDSFHWQRSVALQQRRWESKTGAKIRKAEEVASRSEPVAFDDELDKLVMIQVERQRRLKSIKSAPPVVQRLLHPPPPPPKPLDPLDEFMVYVNKGAGTAQPGILPSNETGTFGVHQPGINVPHQRKGAFAGPANPTRTGLYHAVPDSY